MKKEVSWALNAVECNLRGLSCELIQLWAHVDMRFSAS